MRKFPEPYRAPSFLGGLIRWVLACALLATVGSVTPTGWARASAAPTNITVNADAQAGAVRVEWTAPSGDAPTGYEVLTREVGSGAELTPSPVSGNSMLVTGLTNGVSYEFAVRAIFGATSSDSEYSEPVVPYGLPGQPGDPAPIPGSGQVTLSWARAAENGRPILSYTVRVEPDLGGDPLIVNGDVQTLTIAGLTNGTQYTFTVIAKNARGTTSANPVVATAFGEPAAPTIQSAIPGDGQITVTWAPPSDDGGSGVVSYSVTASATGTTISQVIDATSDPAPTSVVLSGLTNGTGYSVAMTATTAQGFTSELSAPEGPVTPGIVAPPTLNSDQPGLAPTSGGTVELLGTDLSAVSAVGVACAEAVWPSQQVVTATPNSLSFEAPPGCSVGTAQVTVTNSAGTSSPVSLRYRAVPTLASSPVTPAAASAGTTVTLTGTGFSEPSEMTVLIGGVVQEITAGTSSSLSVQIGSLGAAGLKDIVVTTLGSPALRDTAIGAFTFEVPAPPSGETAPPGESGGGGGGGSGGGGAPPSSPSPGTPVITDLAPPATPGAPVRAEVTLPAGNLVLDLSGLRTTGSGPVEVSVVPVNGPPATGASGVSLLGGHLEITLTGGEFTEVELCVPFRAADVAASGHRLEDLRLLHFVGGEGRSDITTAVDPGNNRVCGRATSFSPFGIGAYDTVRLAGADRYRTAIEISRSTFPTGAPVVYIANGLQFPDALAAAPAAVRDAGPVLLTAPGGLSSVVRAELQRLAPAQVILVGGERAISPVLETAVRAAVPSATVERRAGADRYATAAAISAAVFPDGVDTVYVATGRTAPDALAGAAAAGADGSPVLLVPGSGPGAEVPAVLASELRRLSPNRVVILGGLSAISSGVMAELQAVVSGATFTRVAGVDRYDTAARLARPCSSARRLYVATGTQFADALAGAVAAGRDGCPMLLVPPSGLTPRLRTALSSLSPADIWILGGSSAVSFRAEGQLAYYLP